MIYCLEKSNNIITRLDPDPFSARWKMPPRGRGAYNRRFEFSKNAACIRAYIRVLNFFDEFTRARNVTPFPASFSRERLRNPSNNTRLTKRFIYKCEHIVYTIQVRITGLRFLKHQRNSIYLKFKYAPPSYANFVLHLEIYLIQT